MLGAVLVLAVIALAFALAWGLPGFLPAPPAVVPSAERRLDPALDALIEQHRKAVEQHPRNTEVRGTLGLVYEANELWSEAAATFEQCRELGSDDPSWAYHQALCLRQAGDQEAARNILEALSPEHPQFAALQFRLAQWRLESGDIDGARALFSRANVLEPRRPEPLTGLANCYLRNREYETALRFLDDALELESGYKPAVYAAGLAYRGLGDLDKAERYLSQGTDAQVRYLGDPRAADMMRLMVSYASVMDSAADMIAQGNAGQAIPILNAALKQRPGDLGLLNNLSVALWSQGRKDEAMRTLRETIDLHPAHFSSHYQLASYLLDSARPDEALDVARRATELDALHAGAAFSYGRALCSLGRNEDGMKQLQKARELGMNGPAIFQALAGTAAMLRDYDAAQGYFEEGTRSFPNEIDLWLGLAEVRVRLGEQDGAREAWTAARNIAPDHPRVQAFQQRLNQMGQQP